MPPAVLTGLQQAPAASATTAANSSAAPRPFKATTDPVAVAKKRAAALEADRKQKKETQMNLKRVTETMPQASSGEVHSVPSTGIQSHVPHCCGKLPADCLCHLQGPGVQASETATPGTTDHQIDPEVAGNVQVGASPTINLDDDDDDLLGGGVGEEASGLTDAPDAQALPLFREASPAQ